MICCLYSRPEGDQRAAVDVRDVQPEPRLRGQEELPGGARDSNLQGTGSLVIHGRVFFWYLVKSDMSSVRVYCSIHWTSHFLQGTRKTLPCLSGRVVQDTRIFKLVRLFYGHKKLQYNIYNFSRKDRFLPTLQLKSSNKDRQTYYRNTDWLTGLLTHSLTD